MTFKQLEYFLEIAATENITKAAENLNISQPPLSLQLKSLEEEFGIKLFKRSKKKLVITNKGLLLQERATQILNLLNETVYDLQVPESNNETVIRIGTISSVSNTLLPKKIAQYKEINPSVHYEIYEGNTTTILNQLSEGIIDLGVIREPFNMNPYHSIPLKNSSLGDAQFDYFVAIAKASFYKFSSYDYIDLAELRGKPLIMHRRYKDLWANTCRQKGFIPDFFCLNNDIFSSLRLAEEGVGIAIAPYTSAQQNNNPNLILKKILHPAMSSRAHLVWSVNLQMTEEVQGFIQLFRN